MEESLSGEEKSQHFILVLLWSLSVFLQNLFVSKSSPFQDKKMFWRKGKSFSLPGWNFPSDVWPSGDNPGCTSAPSHKRNDDHLPMEANLDCFILTDMELYKTLGVLKSIVWRWDYSPGICAAHVELIHTVHTCRSIAIESSSSKDFDTCTNQSSCVLSPINTSESI